MSGFGFDETPEKKEIMADDTGFDFDSPSATSEPKTIQPINLPLGTTPPVTRQELETTAPLLPKTPEPQSPDEPATEVIPKESQASKLKMMTEQDYDMLCTYNSYGYDCKFIIGGHKPKAQRSLFERPSKRKRESYPSTYDAYLKMMWGPLCKRK